jgi:hypothetical protein
MRCYCCANEHDSAVYKRYPWLPGNPGWADYLPAFYSMKALARSIAHPAGQPASHPALLMTHFFLQSSKKDIS